HVGRLVEVLDDILFVIAAFTGRQGVDTELVKIDRVVPADAEPAGRALSVGNNEVDCVLLAYLCEELLRDPDAGLADDLPDKEDTHGCHQERIPADRNLDKFGAFLLRFFTGP